MSFKVRKQREIIDRLSINASLDSLAADPNLDPQQRRATVLSLLKAALLHGTEVVRARFEGLGDSGTDVVHNNSFLMDQIIRIIYDFATTHVFPHPEESGSLGVVAVGGFGRGELAPFSDLDLLFLLPDKSPPHFEQVIEFMLYMLWDLGLKVGHSTRSMDECMRQAQADTTIRTAMLEARWLWGDQELYKKFRKRFRAEGNNRQPGRLSGRPGPGAPTPVHCRFVAAWASAHELWGRALLDRVQR